MTVEIILFLLILYIIGMIAAYGSLGALIYMDYLDYIDYLEEKPKLWKIIFKEDTSNSIFFILFSWIIVFYVQRKLDSLSIKNKRYVFTLKGIRKLMDEKEVEPYNPADYD